MPKIEKDLLKVKGSDGQWHYVPAVGGSVDTAPTWDSVQNKPFTTLGSGLSVDKNGVLSAEGGSSGSANAVQYVEQTLTDEQKKQARTNIGASPIPTVRYWLDLKADNIINLYNMGVGYGIISPVDYDQTVPTGMSSPMLVIFGRMNYGRVDITVYDGAGAVWRGSLNLSSQTTDVTKTGDYVTNTALTDILQNYVPAENYEENLQEIAQALTTKLDKNQGAGNAGKILGVGEDGNVVPQDKPSGSTVTVDSELSSTSLNPVQNKIITAALAEKITAPTTAAVGQIIKVKSVDDAGKPTEWECADLPSGGGGGKEEPTINNLLCETVFPANNVAAQEITCDVTCAQLAQYKELHFSIRGANNTSIPNLYLSVAGINDAHLIRMIAAGFYGIVRRDFENSNLVRVWTGTSNPSLVPDSPTDSKTYLYDTFTVGMQPKILDWTKIFAAADKKLILKCSSTPTIDYTLKIYGVVAMT
jgi:hypothetical protein